MRALLLAATLGLAAAGCKLESPTVSCGGPQDCLLPLVCCAGGLGVTAQGFSGPTCLSREICTAGGGTYAPFFPEGAPCRRAPGGEACAQGLTCCPKTLTCATEATCEAAPVPPDVDIGGSAPTCGGDNDCAQGVCCGITWAEREGVCQSVASCAAANGVVTPRPDAGVPADAGPTPDAGSTEPLADVICEAATCTPDGARPPSATERRSCLRAFETGVDALGRSGLVASEACRAAVDATRDICNLAFAWRNDVVPTRPTVTPIFPGDCYAPARTHPDAAAACANLVACGRADDQATCEAWLGALTHDTLVRLAAVEGCAFDRDALGFAGRPLLGKCADDTHCPEGTTCLPDLAPGGACTIPGCADPGPCADLGGVCVAGLCTLPCNPRIQNVQARRAVAQQCAARVVKAGRPVDFACAAQAEGEALCVPAVDPATCPQGVEPLRTADIGPLDRAYRCAEVTTSTLALFSPCAVPAPGAPEPCGEGVCVADDGGERGACLDPCVSTPVDTDGFTCPAGQACMDTPELGWGAVGYCRLRCRTGECADGTSCAPSWPAAYCR